MNYNTSTRHTFNNSRQNHFNTFESAINLQLENVSFSMELMIVWGKHSGRCYVGVKMHQKDKTIIQVILKACPRDK